MSMSVSSVGSSYPIAANKPQGPAELALTPLSSEITPTPTALKMAPQGMLVRVSAPMNFPTDWSAPEAIAEARASGAYGLAGARAREPAAEPEPLREVAGLGFIPGDVFTSQDPGAIEDYLRGQVADARDAARREREMSDATGQDVRLALDPKTGRELALTRDDPGFNAVRGARAMFADMGSDLGKMGFDPSRFRDALQL